MSDIILERDVNNEPRRIEKWFDDGCLGIVRRSFSEITKSYVEGTTEIITPINRKNFEVIEDPQGNKLIRDKVNRRVLEPGKYLDSINIAPRYKAWALQAIDTLSVSTAIAHGLELFEDGGYLKILAPEEMYLDNEFAVILANCMKCGKDRDQLMASFKALWKVITPKQRTDCVASVGIPLRNVIIRESNLEYRLCYQISYGPTTLGKSFGYIQSMKIIWGFFLRKDSLFSSDIIDAPWRYHAMMAGTNLAIYIDESTSATEKILAAIKASAMQGITGRGRADQTVKLYKDRATLTTTAQRNGLRSSGSFSDQQALGMRLYEQRYIDGAPDKILDESILKAQDEWVANCREGGLIYLLLAEHPMTELIQWVIELEQRCRGDSAKAGLLLGLRILGMESKEWTDQMQWDRGTDEGQGAKEYELIVADAMRMQNGRSGQFPDFFAKEMETRMKIEDEWVFINNNYLAWINSDKRHPLCGKFESISDLRQLQNLVDTQSVTPLVTQEVFNRDARTRIGGKPCVFAKIPLELDTQRNTCVTLSVTEIIDNKDNSVTQVTHNIDNTPKEPENTRFGIGGDVFSDLRNSTKKDLNVEGICPVCGKPGHIWEYGGSWYCTDCLNAKQHSNDGEIE